MWFKCNRCNREIGDDDRYCVLWMPGFSSPDINGCPEHRYGKENNELTPAEWVETSETEAIKIAEAEEE